MKKNNFKPLIIVLILVLIISIGIYFLNTNNNKKQNTTNNVQEQNISDSVKFKQDYEAQNATKDDDNNLKYISMSLPDKMPFKYATTEDVFNLFEKGTGVIYFGMPECNWCRTMLPILIDVANENKIDTILYFNPKQIRADNTPEYQKLVEILKNYLSTDTSTQKETDTTFDKNKKRLYMPDVYVVKNGMIIGNHADTVNSQEAPKVTLTDSQKTELKKIFTDLLSQISSKTCDENTKEGC